MSANASLFPHKKSSQNDDNLIPLINIVFLLLVFFMVAGQIRAMPDADLALPSSTLKKQPDATPVLLELNQHNELHLNGKAVASADLLVALQALTSQAHSPLEHDTLPTLEPEPTPLDVALFVDKQITAAQLTTVLAPLRQQSIARIQLHTLVDPGQDVTSPSVASE